MHNLRKDLFEHILSLRLSFFDNNPIGKLVNRVTNDIEALNEMFSSVLITLFQDFLILTGIIVVMFSDQRRPGADGRRHLSRAYGNHDSVPCPSEKGLSQHTDQDRGNERFLEREHFRYPHHPDFRAGSQADGTIRLDQ